MQLIVIDRAKCTKCGTCVEVCPMGVIEICSAGFPESTKNAYALCINCGYCVDICGFEALFHQVRKRTSDSQAAMQRYDALKKRTGQ